MVQLTPTITSTISSTYIATSIPTTSSTLIILFFKTIPLEVARFTTVVANLSRSQDHRCRPFVIGIAKLRYILIIYILLLLLLLLIVSTTITQGSTTVTIIILLVLIIIIMARNNPITISHVCLISPLSEQDHVLECSRTMHEYLSSYMGFEPI
jgi:hypothetical protein